MNPTGLCKCGCGERTPLAKTTDARWGTIKGRPTHFVNGHHNRKALPLEKRCRGECGRVLPIAEFPAYRHKGKPGVYHAGKCRPCQSAARQRWAAAHPERNRAASQRFYEKVRTDPEYVGVRRAKNRERLTGSLVYKGAAATGAGLVDAGPVLAAVERSGVSHTTISARVGWEQSSAGKAIDRAREAGRMQAGTALRLLEAIDVLPVEVGL